MREFVLLERERRSPAFFSPMLHVFVLAVDPQRRCGNPSDLRFSVLFREVFGRIIYWFLRMTSPSIDHLILVLLYLHYCIGLASSSPRETNDIFTSILRRLTYILSPLSIPSILHRLIKQLKDFFERDLHCYERAKKRSENFIPTCISKLIRIL